MVLLLLASRQTFVMNTPFSTNLHGAESTKMFISATHNAQQGGIITDLGCNNAFSTKCRGTLKWSDMSGRGVISCRRRVQGPHSHKTELDMFHSGYLSHSQLDRDHYWETRNIPTSELDRHNQSYSEFYHPAVYFDKNRAFDVEKFYLKKFQHCSTFEVFFK